MWLLSDVLRALLCDNDNVFHTDAELIFEVDSGFDGEGHADLKFNRRGGDGEDEAGVVGLEADAVAESVGEAAGVTCFRDDIAGDGVDLVRGDAGAHRSDGRLLGMDDLLVNLPRSIIGAPETD